MTPTISDSERHARACLFEAGIPDPSIALLRARLMLDRAKNARDLACSMVRAQAANAADNIAAYDGAEAAAFDTYVTLLRQERERAAQTATINVSITRDGVTTNLSTCTLSPEALASTGILAPWIEPDPIGFGTLTPFEREQTRRLAEATISYCETGCGEMATMTE